MREEKRLRKKYSTPKNAYDLSHNTCPVSIVSFSISLWPCLISSVSVFLTEPFLNLMLQNTNKENILTRRKKVTHTRRSGVFVSSAPLTCRRAGCGGCCGLSSVSQRLCPPADNPPEHRLSQGCARRRQCLLHRNVKNINLTLSSGKGKSILLGEKKLGFLLPAELQIHNAEV